MRSFTQLTHRLGVFGLLFVVTASCAQDIDEPQTEAVKPERAPPIVKHSDENTIVTGAHLTRQVDAAKADLSSRIGVDRDAITVVKASMVNWASSAVGCPRHDMNYMQVIIPGFLVLLGADGKVYRYHGSREGELFHCPDDRAEAPAFGSGEEFM